MSPNAVFTDVSDGEEPTAIPMTSSADESIDATSKDQITSTESSIDAQALGRTVELVNEGWSFNTNDSSSTGWNFPQGDFSSTVDLPHSWEYVHPTMSFIPIYNAKTATYSKTIDVSSYQNRELFIKFYAVNKVATVKVDGQVIGTHDGGYSAFTFDLTPYINGKDSIELSVDVTNVTITSTPVNVDYTQWSGIYRDVELISVPKQSFSLMNYGSDGIFIDYSLDDDSASLSIRAGVSNYDTISENMMVRATILDLDGVPVFSSSKEAYFDPSAEGSEINISGMIDEVHRWNGVDDPYLYTAKIELLNSNGQTVDEISQRIGFRTFTLSNGKAYLNGNEIEIHGVGYHQDRQNYGNAVTKESMSEDVDTMLDMGVNAVRTSHYPHDPYFYELADEKGLLVYCEIPYYMIYSKAQSFQDSVTNQLKEMIRQGYNFTSIVMWGIQNEVYYNSQYATYGDDFNVSQDELDSFNSSLVDLAWDEDSSRMVVQAQIDNSNAVKETANWSDAISLTGMNLYVGYKGSYLGAEAGSGIEGHKALVNALSTKMKLYCDYLGVDQIMMSEYGSGSSINLHSEVDNELTFDAANNTDAIVSEEYQCFFHEAYWDFISGCDYIPASFVWNMYDFSSYRNEAGISRQNSKGLVCYDHSTKKDAYYFYRANWNDNDEFVYLTSKRFTERNKSVQQIKAYSNCDQVELFVNGASVGLGTKQQQGVYVWDNVGLDASSQNSLRVLATGSAGDTYEDSIDGITVNVMNGWNSNQSRWYDNGVMAKDHCFYDPDSDAWYWADSDGSIATDKDVFIPQDEQNRDAGGKWVRFDANRKMIKGEDYRYGGWYYFDPVTGEMAKGMNYIPVDGGKWVYYDWINGQMAHGEAYLDYDEEHIGWYLFDSYTGAVRYGWQVLDDGRVVYYDKVTGQMYHGQHWVDGLLRNFDLTTGALK